jgi:hypothetical protein
MIYLDYNHDRNCQWSDIPEETQQEAAQAMLEKGKFLIIVNGLWCKLEKQETTFLEEVLGIETVAPTKGVTAHETILEKVNKSGQSRLGSSQQMTVFRDLVIAGYTRAAWVAEEMDLKAYQVSRLAKRAIRSGWLVKQGMDYAMRFSTGRPRKL